MSEEERGPHIHPPKPSQAQRDFFGSHTFERKDKPQGEMFHCLWTDDHSATTGH